jgi:hypothetical protein
VISAGVDDGEGHLERAEEHERDGQEAQEPVHLVALPDVAQEGEVEVPDEPAVAGVAEGEREHDRRPEDRQDPHGEEVLHDHGEHVLPADHACVEQRQTRRHEEHQGG